MTLLSKGSIFTALRAAVLFSTLPIAIQAGAEEDQFILESKTASVTKMQAADPLDSTVTYSSAFFSQYDPVTALDMLNRIPGIDSVLNGGGGNRRGLGAGGSSILIDGKRIAGKSNSGKDVLGRIAAKQVAEVEIIRGSSADLDVRTAGPIVNVIMREGAGRSSISAELNADLYHDNTVRPGGSLSLGGQNGDLDYLASFTAEPRYEYQKRREYSVLGDGSPNDELVQTRTREQTDHELAGNFGYRLSSSGLLQFNAYYRDNSSPHEIERARTDFKTDAVETTWQREDRSSDRSKWEVGSDYQHSYANGGRLKLIVVANEDTNDWFYDRFNVQPTAETKSLYIGEEKRTRERIGRASYNVALNSAQDIEVGIEGAQTILDKSFRLGVAGEGTPSAAFGGLTPSSDVKSTVAEIRYEPFVIHNWQISSAASLESTLIAELSEISQEGTDNGELVKKAREFKFLKPKLDYRYDVTPVTQLRATVERDVSQLSFSHFSASSNGDLEKDINAGNPNLQQEKSWRYELNVEHRLDDDRGVLSSRVFYHDLEDIIDRVAVSNGPTSWISAAGNIGDGKRYGASLDASIRLHALDIPNALVTAGALVTDSEVTDPFLNETRRLSGHGRGRLKLGIRHDLPALNVNYGLDYTYFFGGERNIDIDDVQDRYRSPNSSLFVEKVAFGRVTLRLESINVLNNNSCYERTRYVGSTAGGVVGEVENYCYDYGRKIAFKMKTTF